MSIYRPGLWELLSGSSNLIGWMFGLRKYIFQRLILLQSLPGRIHRLGSLHIRHLGEAAELWKAFGNFPTIRESKSEIGDCERFALAIPNFASFPRIYWGS